MSGGIFESVCGYFAEEHGFSVEPEHLREAVSGFEAEDDTRETFAVFFMWATLQCVSAHRQRGIDRPTRKEAEKFVKKLEKLTQAWNELGDDARSLFGDYAARLEGIELDPIDNMPNARLFGVLDSRLKHWRKDVHGDASSRSVTFQRRAESLPNGDPDLNDSTLWLSRTFDELDQGDDDGDGGRDRKLDVLLALKQTVLGQDLSSTRGTEWSNVRKQLDRLEKRKDRTFVRFSGRAYDEWKKSTVND